MPSNRLIPPRSALPILGALLAAPAACLPAQAPEGTPPMCELNTDCDYLNGEICDQGVCWGDPPEELQFAAILVGPEEKATLVPTELREIRISEDGTISDLVFDEQVKISGRVVLACAYDANPLECDPERSIAAQIKATRASRIAGGPEYSRTVTAEADLGPGESAFELYLPIAKEGDEPYEISIIPEDATANQELDVLTPAELAPPIRFALTPTQDMPDVEWVLGDPLEHKVVIGHVFDAAERGRSGMRVWAVGRWTPTSSPERASSISTTDDDGFFAVRIPIAMLDIYDLVVKPGPDTSAPTLRLRDIYIPDPEVVEQTDNIVEIEDLRMPVHADPVLFVLPVNGTDSGGTAVPVAGADVRLTTILTDDPRIEATYTDQGLTDQDGNVELRLIPGGMQNRVYEARIIPPPSSEHATLDGVNVSVGQGSATGPSYLAGPTLTRRVPLHGVILTHDGTPVKEATVSAAASLELKWSLALETQAELEFLQFASDTTGENGAFQLWLDPILVDHPALYDLEIVPPADANASRWSIESVHVNDADNELEGVDLAEIKLPPASFARGTVVSASGETVVDAEFRLYQLSPNDDLCMGAILPEGAENCVAPVRLRGLWKSGEEGRVEIVLPDPASYR